MWNYKIPHFFVILTIQCGRPFFVEKNSPSLYYVVAIVISSRKTVLWTVIKLHVSACLVNQWPSRLFIVDWHLQLQYYGNLFRASCKILGPNLHFVQKIHRLTPDPKWVVLRNPLMPRKVSRWSIRSPLDQEIRIDLRVHGIKKLMVSCGANRFLRE